MIVINNTVDNNSRIVIGGNIELKEKYIENRYQFQNVQRIYKYVLIKYYIATSE